MLILWQKFQHVEKSASPHSSHSQEERILLSCSWLRGEFSNPLSWWKPIMISSNILVLNLNFILQEVNSNLMPVNQRLLRAFIRTLDRKISPQSGAGQGHFFLVWMATMWARRFFFMWKFLFYFFFVTNNMYHYLFSGQFIIRQNLTYAHSVAKISTWRKIFEPT